MDINIMLDRLRNYGVNINEIRDRFMDDFVLYSKCLDEFLSDNNFRQLKSSIETGDHRKAYEAAHSLKGMSGNMGLTPLYKVICEISDSLKNNRYDNLDKQYAKVAEEYEKVSDIAK